MRLFSLLDMKYSNFTSTIKTYLTRMLSEYNMNFDNNTIFGQLINVVSGAIQNIMLYIEDSLVEQNKYTAQRKKSIYGLASLSGYEPFTGKTTGVQIRLSHSPTNENVFDVIINNHQQLVCTQNGLFYNLVLPQESIIMSIDKDNSEKYLHAVQGKFESQTFISTGGKFYTQNFKYQGYIDLDYIEVEVNGELWDKCDSLYDMESNSNQFIVKTNYIGGVDVIFGNDVHGRSLNDGDMIKITYLLHDGEQGNLDPNKETYFVFNEDLMDTAGNNIDGNGVFVLTFANNDSVISGTNGENIELTKQMIGLNSRSLVLASVENYKKFISQFSFCGYNRTWGESNSPVINSIIMKNYKLHLDSGKDYFNLNELDFTLSKNQKKSILNYIKDKGSQLAGITYNIFDPEICKYALYIYVKMKPVQYDKNYIETNIKDIVGNFFSTLKNDMYIPKSDIINIIKNNIDSIDGINAYFLSEKNERALLTKSYVNNIYSYNTIFNKYDKKQKIYYVEEGENPNLGLDEYGNIELSNETQFPVLLGGWDYLNKEGQEVHINNPLIIIIN